MSENYCKTLEDVENRISTSDDTFLWNIFSETIKPDDYILVSEWAEKNRILPEENSEPGPWRNERTPYLVEIMDCLSPQHPSEFVVGMMGTQLGKTECGLNWVGCTIDTNPGLMMLVMPGLTEVRRNVKVRIDPLFDSTPCLKNKVSDKRARDSSNSIFHKKYPGGHLVLTGANSAVGLRSTPARYLDLDEIDGYPMSADDEGDPIQLAIRRTTTFKNKRKILLISTPKLKGSSRIESWFERSDKRYYFVPCKHCNEYSVIKWDHIKWDKPNGIHDPSSVRWECPVCGGHHRESDKTQLLQNGKWIATETEKVTKIVGFHLSGLYSPFESWTDVVHDFLDAQKDSEKMQVWVNTVLAETWEEKGDVPEWETIYNKREEWEIPTVPAGGLFLTCGVDVQADRLEAYIWAWGRNRESWRIDKRVFYGSTFEDDVWDELYDLLAETWVHECGQRLNLAGMAVDSGYATSQVYRFVRRVNSRNVIAIKGQDNAYMAISSPTYVEVNVNGKKIKKGVRLYKVGVSMLKLETMRWIDQQPPTDQDKEEKGYPTGYIHLPKIEDEEIKQMVSESQVTRVVKGYKKKEWHKNRERNEALDCRIYARAMASQLGWDRMDDDEFDQLESLLKKTDEEKQVKSSGRQRTRGRRRR